MKGLNLAGPPGVQDSSDGEIYESKPSEARTKKLQQEQTSDTESPKSPGKKKGKIVNIIYKVIVAYLILTFLLIIGDYIYNNFINPPRQITKSASQQRKQQAVTNQKTPDHSQKHPIPNKKYISQIVNSKSKLKAGYELLSALPPKAFIKTLDISEYSLEGKIHFLDKKTGSNYQNALFNKLPKVQFENYELTRITGMLPFKWSAYMYLDIAGLDYQETNKHYGVLSDRQLSIALSNIVEKSNVQLTKFWISSKKQNVIRDFILAGQGKTINVSSFYNNLLKRNLNLSYDKIVTKTDKSQALLEFQIEGKIYPGN
ncbi:MAG: hypothetical protein K9M80_09655 [Candidatus Marinimicrobia bacterium]|nr:hypothetical protein [Candidatus Neomarinimicrobiota bacterium]